MDTAYDKAQSSEEESSRGHSKEYAQTITYSLGDPDPKVKRLVQTLLQTYLPPPPPPPLKDKFVIQVLGNDIFGTPLFYTLGGASCCPGVHSD
jgi:hypothetical protein